VVMGSGAVYVVDGMRESYTNVFEEQPDTRTSVLDLRLHILRDAATTISRRPRHARGPLKGQEQR
jgi:cyanophycinase-like exopeptidase